MRQLTEREELLVRLSAAFDGATVARGHFINGRYWGDAIPLRRAARRLRAVQACPKWLRIVVSWAFGI